MGNFVKESRDFAKWLVVELRITFLLACLAALNGAVIYLCRADMSVLATMGPFVLQMDIGMAVAISSRALLPALEKLKASPAAPPAPSKP